MKDAADPAVGPLLSLAEVAKRVHVHPKTLARLLRNLMEREPRLVVRRVGRSIMFTEADYEMLLEAMAWRAPGSDLSASRPVRTVARVKRSNGLTVQESLRQHLSEKLAADKRARQERKIAAKARGHHFPSSHPSDAKSD